MTANFIWFPGTSNNGLLTTVLTLMTTEIESLGSGSSVVSSVGGASGVFSNTNTGQAIWADLFLDLGNPGVASNTSAGANLAGWFFTSPDGTTFETVTPPPRPVDFIIPLPSGTTIAANVVFKSQGVVRMPALPFKVLIQNNCGQAFGNGGTVVPYLKMAPFAVQY